MNELIVVDIASTGSVEGGSLETQLDQTNVSPMPWPASRTIPPAIDKGQVIYWTYAWRAGEEETRKALSEGQGKTFPNAQEAIRWLLSDDV